MLDLEFKNLIMILSLSLNSTWFMN